METVHLEPCCHIVHWQVLAYQASVHETRPTAMRSFFMHRGESESLDPPTPTAGLGVLLGWQVMYVFHTEMIRLDDIECIEGRADGGTMWAVARGWAVMRQGWMTGKYATNKLCFKALATALPGAQLRRCSIHSDSNVTCHKCSSLNFHTWKSFPFMK